MHSFRTAVFEYRMAIGVYVLLFFLIFCFLPKGNSFSFDTHCWSEWAKFIFINGLGNVYKSSTDYLPLYHYFLFAFGKLFGTIETMDHYFYLLKGIPLVFDFIAVIYVYKILTERGGDKNTSLLMSFFILLNVAYLYNTVIWGQVDAIMMAFVFLAFYYAWKEKIEAGIVFSLLSVNMKLQAIIFIPFIALLLLPAMTKKFSGKKIFLWILLIVGVQLLIVLPFLLQSDLDKLWAVVIGSFGKYPVVSIHAFNIWYWLLEDPFIIQDSTVFAGISYNKWGLLMYTTAYTLALAPLLKITFGKIFNKSERSLSLEKLTLTGALIPVLFFFFNTQMHERYSHPAFIFIGLYALLTGSYGPYILFSIAYFLNMEKMMQYFEISNYETLIFNNKFLATLYFLSILWMIADLYDLKARARRSKDALVK